MGRNRTKIDGPTAEKVFALRKLDYTYAEIGKELGLSENMVSRIISGERAIGGAPSGTEGVYCPECGRECKQIVHGGKVRCVVCVAKEARDRTLTRNRNYCENTSD